MPPLSLDPCEACFPPTVDTTEESELRSTRTSEGTGSAGDRCAQATDCSLRLRPAGLAYDVRCGQGGVRGELEATECVGECGSGAVGQSRRRRSGITGIIVSAPSDSSVALAPQPQGFASDETVSSAYETLLKQTACSMAVGSVLTKCPLRHSPHPCLGRGPLEDHPALEKGRCPAAFFFCRRRTAPHLFPCAADSPRRQSIAIPA
jgi:hypothetical protein